jgi:outer membrane protein assembly factor BamD
MQTVTDKLDDRRFHATLLAAVACLSLLSGCETLWSKASPSDESADESTGESTEQAAEPEAEAKELTSTTTPPTDSPEADLVRTSERLFQSGMYTLARDSFQTLHDQYPMGAHAKFAEVKSADACFFNGEYSTAAKRYEEFLKNFPAGSDTPYVRLQAARSHLASSRGSGRDRMPLEKALALFDSVVTEFATTPYAVAAIKEREPVIEELANYDRMIMDFYAKRENAAAVEVRRKQFQERWAGRLPIPSGPESEAQSPQVALQQEVTPSENEPNEVSEELEADETSVPPAVVANEAAVPSGDETTPGDPVLIDPPVEPTQVVLQQEAAPLENETIEDKTIEASEPLAREETGLEEASAPSVTQATDHTDSRLRVQRITCRPGPPAFALVEFEAQTAPLPATLDGETLSASDGQAAFPDLQFSSEQRVFDCFGAGDVRIDSNSGSLTVQSNTDLTVFTLLNPPRLILMPDSAG